MFKFHIDLRLNCKSHLLKSSLMFEVLENYSNEVRFLRVTAMYNIKI